VLLAYGFTDRVYRRGCDYDVPKREIDWHLVDDEFNAYAVEMLKASDVLIMGRRTYELMAGVWPGDGLLPVCGSELAAYFLEQGLVDELRIIRTPIVLGAGNTVFDGIKKRYPLKLLSTRSFESGNVVLIYQPTAR